MSFSCGIVGLPNVGKSTLFNALTNSQVEAKNYPFCTIEPNRATVSVFNEKVAKLAELNKSKKTIFSTIEFVDIAGLVKGASKGEGLGNQFIANISQVDAIIEVVRLFTDQNVSRDGAINPLKDIEIIHNELIFYDYALVEKHLARLDKEVKHAPTNERKILSQEIQILERAKKILLKEDLLNNNLFPKEIDVIKKYGLITAKPFLTVANIDEAMLSSFSKTKSYKDLKEYCDKNKTKLIELSSIAELELSDINVSLDKSSMQEYLDIFKIKEPGCSRLIKESYDLLQLISFITTGEKETRSWTIKKNTAAPQAAGKIHSDLEKGFICVEVVDADTLIELKSWRECKAKGKIRSEGKDYVIANNDVCLFRFNL